MLYDLAKKFLFRLNPEKAHYLTMDMLKFAYKNGLYPYLFGNIDSIQPKERYALGSNWVRNPIGLAAGFDKNALWLNELYALGFGFIEIGTVTPKPQEGNPKPRLFRIIQDKALINRMGFNNDGLEAIASRLERAKRPKTLIIGGNIGKNKDTPNEDAHLDYSKCFKRLYHTVHYFTVNVSSPNTPNLRALQDKDSLYKILSELQSINHQSKDIFLKIAPDIERGALDDIISIVTQTKIKGIIANNTSISREGLTIPKKDIDAIGAGGLSGLPIKEKSEHIFNELRKALSNDFVIISSGGVMESEDIKKRLDWGADAVQIYSGFVYSGPLIIKNGLKAIQ